MKSSYVNNGIDTFFVDPVVTLKNGINLPKSTVITVLNHLNELRENKIQFQFFYQFVQHCRLPEDNILVQGNLPLTLLHRNLIDHQAKVADEVRAIVLCAVEGIGPTMHMVSPLKNESQMESKFAFN